MSGRLLQAYVDFYEWFFDDAGWVIALACLGAASFLALVIGCFPGAPSLRGWLHGWLVLVEIALPAGVLIWGARHAEAWARETLTKTPAKPKKPLGDYLYEQAKRELDEMFPADKEDK